MENETKNKGYLKEDERIRISNMLEKGESLSMISKALGRSKTTISDEVQKHCRYEEKDRRLLEERYSEEILKN